MKKNLYLILTTIVILFFSSCGVKDSNKIENSNKLNVYTSFYAMYDFTSKIGGDKINIKNLVPSGIEPHDYEPSPSDIANLEKADILIYNGAGMEGWIDKVLDSLNNKNLVIVETSKGLKLIENTNTDEDLKYDPHVWLNPQNAKKQMEIIKDALVSKDPQNKEYYEKNYVENAKKIDELDKEYKDAVSKFKTKDIVVSHSAFGYLCDAYNLNQIAIEGLLADAEPTPSKMAQIVKFAKENNIKYIFFEDLISPKVAQAIAREINAKTAVLNPFEGLKDEDIKAGKEYFSVMRENLKILKEALQ